MKALFFFVFLTVFLVVASDVTVSPCNQVCCRGPSHVNQCCQAHKFLGGYCDSNNVAWCKEAPGQERSPNARSVHKPPCDETCTNGGYVRECCRAHGLKGGVCDQGRAYCDLPDDESQGSSTYVPTAPRFQNNTTLAWFNPNALGPPETVEMECRPHAFHK